MKKKVFTIILIILIIVISSFFIKKIIAKNKFNYEIAEIKEYNYYVYVDNNKLGVIDKNGNILIKAKYSNIIIPNPEKDVFICYDSNNIETLNSKNEKIFDKFDTVEPVKLKNVASTLPYEKSVLVYEKDNKYGLIDFQGKILTKNIYDSIENLSPTEGKFLVSKNEKYGVIDLKGNTIINTEYDKIQSDEYYTEENEYKQSGFLVLNKTDDGYKYGYIDYKGKMILNVQFNEIERILKEDDKNIYLIVSENGQYGIYKNSKKILENEYQSISYNEDIEVAILQKNKKYGVASLDGKIVIEVNKDAIDVKGIYLYTEKENDKKVYDEKGNIIDINYNRSIYKTENEKYRISTILNNDITYYGITNKEGNQLVEEKYRYIEYLYQNYFIATDENGNLGVINDSGKNIINMKYDSLQKIKGKNIVQATDSKTGITQIYSSNMEKVLDISKPIIQNQEQYIIISSDDEKVYLDKDGNKIQDTSNLKQIDFPDKIGDYVKQQITIETIYYIKPE